MCRAKSAPKLPPTTLDVEKVRHHAFSRQNGWEGATSYFEILVVWQLRLPTSPLPHVHMGGGHEALDYTEDVKDEVELKNNVACDSTQKKLILHICRSKNTPKILSTASHRSHTSPLPLPPALYMGGGTKTSASSAGALRCVSPVSHNEDNAPRGTVRALSS